MTYIHTHTHTHTYIYIYVCVCVCVCICHPHVAASTDLPDPFLATRLYRPSLQRGPPDYILYRHRAVVYKFWSVVPPLFVCLCMHIYICIYIYTHTMCVCPKALGNEKYSSLTLLSGLH